jgi:hypothetical protein
MRWDKKVYDIFGKEIKNNPSLGKLFSVYDDGMFLGLLGERKFCEFLTNLEDRGDHFLVILKVYFDRLLNQGYIENDKNVHHMVMMHLVKEISKIFETYKSNLRDPAKFLTKNKKPKGEFPKDQPSPGQLRSPTKCTAHHPNCKSELSNSNVSERIDTQDMGPGRHSIEMTPEKIPFTVNTQQSPTKSSLRDSKTYTNPKDLKPLKKGVEIFFEATETTDFIKLLLQKNNIKGSTTETQDILFSEIPISENNDLQSKMDRIKVLMNVRKEFNSITVLEDLETFIQNVSTKAKQLGNEIRKLTMENANLLKINQTVIQDFKVKMAALS